MTHPDAFEEAVLFYNNTAFIAYREPQTRAVYFSVDAIAPYFGFDSAESFLGKDYWLDELYSYRHDYGRLAVREVWAADRSPALLEKEQPILVMAQTFLDQPRIQNLWKADPAQLPAHGPQPEKKRWEHVLEQDVWSEDDFTYLLPYFFADYGVANQRTSLLSGVIGLAHDVRTPHLWVRRLRQLAQWATAQKRTEVHLSDLTRIEQARIDPTPPYIPQPNL